MSGNCSLLLRLVLLATRTVLLVLAVVTQMVTAQNLPMAGVTLRCCVIEQFPYAMSDPGRPEYGNWSGLAIDVRPRAGSVSRHGH
jgi:hypothetical protein